jgi:excisionase family DNA binding protein
MNETARSYSTAEIAKRLGISLQTVQRWVDSGRLKAWKTPGGHRRIDARSAELLFEGQQQVIGAAPAEEPPADAGGRPITVVIVDDDPIYRDLIANMVQHALPQARLRVAGNGFQGLVMIAKWAPDIVVTDVHMPHMDGLEMIRNVLADSETRPRLLIAVTSRPSAELADFGQLPAEVLLLRKPLERDKFVAALQTRI